MSIRRAKLADSDKVRYRVYTSPTEYIAVVADSALMALKVACVPAPYKIVRDLPTDGVAVEAHKMAEREVNGERISFPLQQSNADHKTTELADPSTVEKTPFIPLGIADMQYKGGARARILPPDILNEIIEEHAKSLAAKLLESAIPQPDPPPPEPAPSPPKGTALPDGPVLSPEEVEKLLNA